MPRLKTDYSKTVIYKIVCNNLEIKDLYVGHTTHFTKRKNNHKCACNKKNHIHHLFKVYQTIREHGGWDNWSMIEIEKFSCKDGNEAHARERFWFETLGATLNMIYPNRSKKEWDAEHEVELKEYKKKYVADHADEKKEYDKKYNADHRKEKKEYSKKYETDHREERTQKQRERRAKKRAETQ